MFLTTKGRYAVTAIIDIIANGNSNKPVSLAQISERHGISISYLEQIFLSLKKHKIVSAIKGPGGGYIINKDPDKISVVDILNAAGESIKITKCKNGKTCTGKSVKCVAHSLWEDFEQKIANYLTSITMADIAKKKNFLDFNEFTEQNCASSAASGN